MSWTPGIDQRPVDIPPLRQSRESRWRKVGRFVKSFLPSLLMMFLRKGRGAKPRDAVEAILREAISRVLESYAFADYGDVEQALYKELRTRGFDASKDSAMQLRINRALPTAFAQYKRGQV